MQATSTAFDEGEPIPEKYSCDGQNINPGIAVSGFPEGTKALAMIVDDPDAPTGTFTHWLIWNINPDDPVEENSKPGTEGKNDFGEVGYGGPCPPSGTHRYYFRIFALDAELNLPPGASRTELEKAKAEHTLDETALMGTYTRT